MMLYIFHVDLGSTITADINMTTKTVAELKERIEIETNIAPEHQILLMSGGESLDPQCTVGSYSTGTTDSNPIFLFNTALIQSSTPPVPVTNYVPDDNLDKRFTESLALPATIPTVVSRAELALRCSTLSRDQLMACKRLVHDQHLQQQGWAAVLANFDDVTKYYEDRCVQFQHFFESYLQEREEYIEIAKNLSADLQTLSKIPILPGLRAYAEGYLSPEEYEQKLNESGSSLSAAQGDSSHQVVSLLTWIMTKDKTSLDQVMDETSRSLHQLDATSYEHFKNEAMALSALTKRQDKREISGLSDRLYQLEQVVEQATKITRSQNEFTASFQHNMQRVIKVQDDSVLPDLCTSHKSQLVTMHENYKTICDLRRRCIKAKEELSASIHRHLKWISEVENRIQESMRMLLLYTEKIKRMRKYAGILRQVHESPEMYMNAVAEVVRRRTFSEAFLSWAGNLAYQIVSVHSEEIQRRRDFQSKFDGHFLVHLFPGLDDIPPAFATEAPASFDNGLPRLTVDDVESMKQQLPDLASSVTMPDLNSITQFFSSKSLTGSGVSDEEKDKESNMMVVDEPPKEQEVGPQALADRGDFGSETDTEEFEKIGQAAMDSKQTSYDSMKQQAQQDSQLKQLEESLNSSREEVERLRSIIRAFGNVTGDTVQEMRRELYEIKEQALKERSSVSSVTKELNVMLKLQSQAVREHEQKLSLDGELELAELKKTLREKDEQIESIKSSLLEKENAVSEYQRIIISTCHKVDTVNRQLHVYHMSKLDKSETEKAAMETSTEEAGGLQDAVKQYEDRIKELEEQLAAARIDYEKELKDKCDQLHAEHKSELEMLRGRYKLVTTSTIERSPSDSSLEKIERSDVIALASHESILAQAKKDLEVEKEEAVRKLAKQLQVAYEVIKKNEKCIDSMRSERVTLFKNYQDLQSKNDYLKRSEGLVSSLSLENAKLKNELITSGKFVNYRDLGKERDSLVRQLSDDQMKMSLENFEPDAEEVVGSMKMATKKVKLEKELSTSVSVVSDSSPARVDVATCTEDSPSAKHSSREKKNSSKGKATLATCNCGDIVAMVWDPMHENYIVLQDSETKYFLNSDSLAALGLKSGRSNSPTWAFGEVVEKEFCKAKKAENRYKVSMEEKFYRVKVKPYKKKDKDRSDVAEKKKEEPEEMDAEKPSSSRSTEPNQA